jgi:hypothetical protein
MNIISLIIEVTVRIKEIKGMIELAALLIFCNAPFAVFNLSSNFTTDFIIPIVFMIFKANSKESITLSLPSLKSAFSGNPVSLKVIFKAYYLLILKLNFIIIKFLI